MEATCHKVTGRGRLSVRAGTGQQRVEGFEMRVAACTYLHGSGSTALARQASGLYGSSLHGMDVLFFGSGHPASPLEGRKLGQEVVGIAHCCFRRLRGYRGTLDETLPHRQAQLAHRYVYYVRLRLDLCTGQSGWSGR